MMFFLSSNRLIYKKIYNTLRANYILILKGQQHESEVSDPSNQS